MISHTILSVPLLAIVLLPSEAWARAEYLGQIPNGTVFACATCHVSPAGGGPRNPFGTSTEAALDGANVRWLDLYALDSDGDGQTNGQELGDPCGDWSTGAPAPRLADISAPGDVSSMSPSPDTPACPAPDAGVPDAPVMDVGTSTGGGELAPIRGGSGCRSTSPQLVGGWILVLLGSLRMGRRRTGRSSSSRGGCGFSLRRRL